MKISVINGPNLNMLGIREPGIYGSTNYDSLCQLIKDHCAERGVEVTLYQSNHEGDLVDEIQRGYGSVDGIVINPGAYTHTSIAILDAVKSVGIPTVEVHISEVEKREDFRQISYIRLAAKKTITGHGIEGYTEAIDYLIENYGADKWTVEIKKGRAVGKVTAPPSKSMAHRNLICGAFSPASEISGVHMSKDIEATLGCLDALGANVTVQGETVKLGGLDLSRSPKENSIFCNESGSTLRFMIPICLLFGSEITLTGSERLFQRSLDIYSELCDERGLQFEPCKNGVKVKGPLKSGVFEVRGDVSSQFISGLLFALPHLEGDSTVKIIGALESASYIDLTLGALRNFGVQVERPDEKTFIIRGGQKFLSRCEAVEGDYSNAAFFEALNRIGGEVEIDGLKADSMQGDRVYSQLFDRIEKQEFPIDISDCPDLAPILFAVSAVKGRGEFTGTRRLKIKESDRAEVMRTELAKMGAEVAVGENSVSVKCEKLHAPAEPFCGHNDHRIVMSMAVLSTLTGGVIEGAEAVSKSFPDFFERLETLDIEVKRK